MPEFIGEYGDILTRALRILTNTTIIRQQVAGSKARALQETVARELDNLGKLQDSNIKKPFLPTSFGQFIDHFGATVGIAPYPEKSAEVSASDKVLKFSTKYGTTFGSINNSEGFTIPSGTTITASQIVSPELRREFSDIDTAEGPGDKSIHYTMTADAFCSPEATSVYISARALTPGSVGNVARPNVLTTHSFRNYSDINGRSLIVTNVKPILNGSDAETTASYRYRLSKQIIRAEQANDTANFLAAIAVPGVADAFISHYENGAGTFDLYLKSIAPEVSTQMILAVQEGVNKTQASGNKGYVREPLKIGIEISSQLVFTPDTKEEIKVSVRENARIASIYYLNSLDLGTPLDLQRLRDEIISVDGRIQAVGRSPKTFFDAVFVHYPAKLSTSSRRREKLIISTVQSAPNARILVEQNIVDPIRFS